MSMWDDDWAYSLGLLGMTTAVAVVYGFRVARGGRARFERIDRQGGSPLLWKSLMEMVYWALQPVARGMGRVGLHPNHLTIFSVVLAFIGAIYLARGSFGAGAVIAAVSGLLDALDGMLARMTKGASKSGAVMDSSMDRYSEFFFLGGLMIYYRGSIGLQLLVLAVLLGSFMVSYSTAKADALEASPPRGMMRRPERAVYLTVGAALSAFTMEWLGNSYPMVAALLIIALMANFSAIQRIYALVRELNERERREVDRSTLDMRERERFLKRG